MILDKVFHGVLDQGRGCLLVFDEAETNVCCRTGLELFAYSYHQDTYGAAIETLEEVSKVVDSLYAKVGASRNACGLVDTSCETVGEDSIAYNCLHTCIVFFFPHTTAPRVSAELANDCKLLLNSVPSCRERSPDLICV